MSDNKKIRPVTIEANTQIIFTIKGFIGTMMSVLGLFASFYFLVFIPRAERTETYQKELYNQQLTFISREFIKINSTINRTNSNLEALTKRFNDPNETVIENSGGSFGTTYYYYDPLFTEPDVIEYSLTMND